MSGETYRLGRRWWLAASSTAILALALVLGTLVPLNWYSIQPGPARDVIALVKVKGERTYPPAGGLLLTTVSISSRPIAALDVLAAWFDPAIVLVPRAALFAPGVDDRHQDEVNRADMLQSKYAAVVVALRSIGKYVPRLPGARVIDVFSGLPAEGRVRPGDVILAIDGTAVVGLREFQKKIQARKVGASVRLTVQRKGERLDITMPTARGLDDRGAPRPVVGVVLAPAFAFPVDITIDTQDIGGPSGGLVFALAIADVLTPGDLTKGHIVAATGTISLDGHVGEIGGIEQKVLAAEREGADTFLVPASEAPAAAKVARRLKVIGVRTLAEAMAKLLALTPRR